MRIKYIEKKMRKESLWLIDLANTIIEDYQNRGYELTLRQLYYQLVAKDRIANTEKSYGKLGVIISNARLAGMIDWNAIVDRTRGSNRRPTWSNPSEIVSAIANQYRIDKWEDQDYRVFVWVEKEALAGIIQSACEPNDIQVDYLSCRGYMSQSTIWHEGRHLMRISDKGQIPVILHLGDHDPSGIDMTRDNIERLAMFSGLEERAEFIFERIALNYNQIEQYNPPPNPTKIADSRAKGYISKFGGSSWELDALDPDVLVKLIQSKIEPYQDRDKWNERQILEDSDRKDLQNIADNWNLTKR